MTQTYAISNFFVLHSSFCELANEEERTYNSVSITYVYIQYMFLSLLHIFTFVWSFSFSLVALTEFFHVCVWHPIESIPFHSIYSCIQYDEEKNNKQTISEEDSPTQKQNIFPFKIQYCSIFARHICYCAIIILLWTNCPMPRHFVLNSWNWWIYAVRPPIDYLSIWRNRRSVIEGNHLKIISERNLFVNWNSFENSLWNGIQAIACNKPIEVTDEILFSGLLHNPKVYWYLRLS